MLENAARKTARSLKQELLSPQGILHTIEKGFSALVVGAGKCVTPSFSVEFLDVVAAARLVLVG